MKTRLTFFLLLFLSLGSEAQVSLSLLQDYKLTPSGQDSTGVFCRCFYHGARNKFYVVYAARALSSPPGFNQYYRWAEYSSNFVATGLTGTLTGLGSGAGDYAITMVGHAYYHVTGTGMSAWQYRLTKYDDNFNLVNSITFTIDAADSKADLMLNYANGKLIIGAFHQNGENHPTMSMQSPTWTPQMHKWEFDTSLVQIGQSVYLNESFTPWGGSCIYSNNKYQIVTLDKWQGHGNPNYNLNVYRYDANWNYIDTKALNNDGQWSQGVLWDGNFYYVAYHTGHLHRSGNITLGVYDANWNAVYSSTITNFQVFDPSNNSPTLNTTQHNPNRPYLSKVNDLLYVSYDEQNYVCSQYSPIPLVSESKLWQAHVAVVKINGLTSLDERLKEPTLLLYPNPVKEEMHVSVNSRGTLRLINMVGEIVYSTEVEAGERNIHLPRTESGLYVLQFTTEKGWSQKKVVFE